MLAWRYVCIHESMYGWMHNGYCFVSVYFIFVYMYICIYVHTHTPTHTLTHRSVCVCVRACVRVYLWLCIHTNIYNTHAYIHTYIHAYMCVCVCVCACVFVLSVGEMILAQRIQYHDYTKTEVTDSPKCHRSYHLWRHDYIHPARRC